MAAEWIDRLLAKAHEFISGKIADGGADAFWWEAAAKALEVIEDSEADLEAIGYDALIDLLQRVGLGDDVSAVVAGLQIADADGVIAVVEAGVETLNADTAARAARRERWEARLKSLGQIGATVLLEVLKRAILL